MRTRRYGNYVSGRREPDLATLVRIAQVLQTTPDSLLSFENGSQPDEPIARQRIRAAAEVLSSEELETVAVMIEALADRKRR